MPEPTHNHDNQVHSSPFVTFPNGHLQQHLDRAVRITVDHFTDRALNADQLAATLIDLAIPHRPQSATHRGNVLIYPASVVKLFYFVAVHQWLEDGRLDDTPELRRAMSDMIVRSYNEPTHYIVDLLTDTTSGPELPEPDLASWHHRRNAVNRYFTSLGYRQINVNKKPWSEGPYGRERQANQQFLPNRNGLTTDATARLLTEIVTGHAVSPQRSKEMLHFLRRDSSAETGQISDIPSPFIAPALPEGSKLWSKSGWTSQTRHDAAFVELPSKRRIVLVIFTVDHASTPNLIPTLAHHILDQLPLQSTTNE
jgi:hypothetical protein